MRVLAAVLAVVAAELLVALVDPVAGAVAHGLLLVVLLFRWVSVEDATTLVLTLLPLGRLTSLALTPQYHGPATYALTGLPLLLGVLWMSRGFPGSDEHTQPTAGRTGAAVALSGIPLGWAAHALLPLPVLDDPRAAVTITAGVLVTFLFAGVLEELLFRGLVLRTLERAFGGWAVVLSDVLFVAAYLPVRDPGVLAFMAVVGLAFGEYVRRTRRLAPVAIAHGLMAAGALVVFPVIA
ncbi:CPBP family intramembrane glutamic endopeptidase [Geodermatophilus dictyosporus]|uniref:CPBP family intramembrane glutamic endopeptidase n=1 Tax=Geodermatophilus dictyosporus TaxID=1523247 RepID=UPI001B7EDBDA|nr:CPBP family intramembrane glutamic endopeptidase [Geodermatophilus dictyosporus]